MDLKMFGTPIHASIDKAFREAATKKYGRDLRTPLEEALAYWVIMQEEEEWAECAEYERGLLITPGDMTDYELAAINRLRRLGRSL